MLPVQIINFKTFKQNLLEAFSFEWATPFLNFFVMKPQVREPNTVLDSGFLETGFRISFSGIWIPDSNR